IFHVTSQHPMSARWAIIITPALCLSVCYVEEFQDDERSISPLAQALFEPKTIALIGASGDPKKNTSRPQRFLRKHGYKGNIAPVNPGRAEILGEKAYPNVTAVPGEVDHAFIMVPRDAVAAAIEQCVAKKVRTATIYSDGFAETGEEGRRMQEEVLAIAKAGGVRVLGPNCIGI